MAHTPEHKKAIEDAINRMLGKANKKKEPMAETMPITPKTPISKAETLPILGHKETIWEQLKKRKKQIDEAVGGD